MSDPQPDDHQEVSWGRFQFMPCSGREVERGKNLRMKRWSLVIDVEKCEGCHNCFLACKDEHVGNK